MITTTNTITPLRQPTTAATYLPVNVRGYSREDDDAYVRSHVSELEMIKINFVPAMLRELVMSGAKDVADLLARLRVDGLKRHTRLLRQALDMWDRTRHQEHGIRYNEDYGQYVRRFKDEVYTHIWMYLRNLEEQAAKELPALSRELAAAVNYVLLLSCYVRIYEGQMDRLLTERCGCPVHKRPMAVPTVVESLCLDIAGTYGFKLTVSRDSKLWVKILSNVALKMAEEIYNEEKGVTHG